MRGGIFEADVRFREVLLSELLIRSSGLIFNSFENSFMQLEDIYAYEDENGEMRSTY
jgi:hypothetical protein